MNVDAARRELACFPVPEDLVERTWQRVLAAIRAEAGAPIHQRNPLRCRRGLSGVRFRGKRWIPLVDEALYEDLAITRPAPCPKCGEFNPPLWYRGNPNRWPELRYECPEHGFYREDDYRGDLSEFVA